MISKRFYKKQQWQDGKIPFCSLIKRSCYEKANYFCFIFAFLAKHFIISAGHMDVAKSPAARK